MSATIDPSLLDFTHVRPCGASIIVMPIADESEIVQTASGIFIDTRLSEGGVHLPDTVDAEPIEGIVMALGAGVRHDLPTWLAEKIAADMAQLLIRDGIRVPEDTQRLADRIGAIAAEPHPFQVKVGQKVLWTPWTAFTITLDGVDFYIIEESDIIGTLPG